MVVLCLLLVLLLLLLLTSYICTTMPLCLAGAISARYAGTTMADAPIPSPTSKRPATSALQASTCNKEESHIVR
jgi:hypothetical protein